MTLATQYHSLKLFDTFELSGETQTWLFSKRISTVRGFYLYNRQRTPKEAKQDFWYTDEIIRHLTNWTLERIDRRGFSAAELRSGQRTIDILTTILRETFSPIPPKERSNRK